MARRFATGNLPPASHFFPAINVPLDVNKSPTSTFTDKISRRVITIPELSNDFRFKWEAFPVDNALETLVAVRPIEVPDLNPQYDLTNFNVGFYSPVWSATHPAAATLPQLLLLHVDSATSRLL